MQDVDDDVMVILDVEDTSVSVLVDVVNMEDDEYPKGSNLLLLLVIFWRLLAG